MKKIFSHVKDYFYDRIQDYYSGFTYGFKKRIPCKSIDRKSDIDRGLKEGDAFLSFN